MVYMLPEADEPTYFEFALPDRKGTFKMLSAACMTADMAAALMNPRTAMSGFLSLAADEASLKALGSLQNKQLAALREQWERESLVTPGESSAS